MTPPPLPRGGREEGGPARAGGARLGQPAPRSALALDPYRIVAADFLAGAGPGTDLPAPVTAEIAFAGRSNVGKSSLINILVDRKNLVRTSSTPGSTRQLNLFEARAADGAVFHLVNLPGYGFSHRSKGEKQAWIALIEGYLRTRVTLRAVVLLVDARRGLEQDDRDLFGFVDVPGAARPPVEVIVVATKLDKLPKSSRKAALATLTREAGHQVLGFSSVTKEGRGPLWRAMRRAALGAAPVGPASPGEPPPDEPDAA